METCRSIVVMLSTGYAAGSTIAVQLKEAHVTQNHQRCAVASLRKRPRARPWCMTLCANGTAVRTGTILAQNSRFTDLTWPASEQGDQLDV